MNEGRANCTDNLWSCDDSSNFAKEGEGVFEMVLRLQNEKREQDAKKDKANNPMEQDGMERKI